jgi:hypothetical protein
VLAVEGDSTAWAFAMAANAERNAETATDLLAATARVRSRWICVCIWEA